ncbi:MAG: hypothetical protein AAGK04_06695 [Planctomycetota bacterium]
MAMEGSEVSVEFDSAGLISWAKTRFGIDIDAAELREGGASERRAVQNRLEEAAEAQIDEADLSGIAKYLEEHYGARQLASWAERKFDVRLTVQDVLDAKEAADDPSKDGDVAGFIVDKVREQYDKREIEYPVDFALDMTMQQMRQDPQMAMAQLVNWTKRKFGLELEEETIKKTPPAKVREQLVEQSRAFVESDELGVAIEEALTKDDHESLDAWMRDRLDSPMPDRMRYMEGEEREHAVRAHVENVLRFELLTLERAVLLDVFDTSWKDHLYEMDQLRDAIGFRAFSQQDPRIAFKKEGSRLFNEMMGRIRERVTDVALKARMSTGPAQPQAPAAPRPQARQAAPAAAPVGGMIMGPGITPSEPSPAAQPQRTNGESSDETGPNAESQLEAARAARDADKGRARKR